MRTNIPIIFVLLVLLALLSGTGCVSQTSPGQVSQSPEGQAPRQDVTISRPSVLAETGRISFDEAKARLTDYRLNVLNEYGNGTRVNYLRSRDLDEYGNATGWIFGVYTGQEAEFLMFDRIGWITIPNATIPRDEIDLDTVISPGVLFAKNKAILSENISSSVPEQRDLELQQGRYKLTIISGSTGRTLAFNATTGVLIP